MENCKCAEYKEKLDIQSSKITCLEYEIENLKKDNQELKIENQELKKRITFLEKDNQEFKIKYNNLEFNNLRIKIITAIQDLNNYEKLEVKFTYPLNTCIANIKFNINCFEKNINLLNNLLLLNLNFIK